MKVAKKYRLDYTRYADDLTFSTNDRNFIVNQKEFYGEVSRELLRAGFKINEKKTRLQLRDSKQTVTGIIVNKKLNVDRVYYKETRAMAYSLYTKGFFEINGEKANINQLEGRFSFINQINRYNNALDGKKHNFNNLSSRELQYQKFLFYKYFFANPKPLIITEGKTDIAYLKSAIKNLYAEYPNLITKNSDGTFDFKVAFLNKTKRLKYFLGVFQDGGSALNNVANFFISKKKIHNYLNEFKKLSNTPPLKPVILLFDNELNGPKAKDKPLAQFINFAKLGDQKKDILSKDNMVNIIDNLFLLTVPLIGQQLESDIEDLFDSKTLSHNIEGRTFTKQDNYNVSKFYGKEIFSKYIINNYLDISFNGFRPVLNNIEKMMNIYNASPSQLIQQSLQEKVPIEV